jgi:hypothetical protein
VTEAYSNPIQTIIDEIRTLSPETTNALIFRNNGQTIANTQTGTENQTKKFVANFANISVQAQAIGGIENFTIQSAENQLNIVAVEDCFLATISSQRANQEILKSITKVVVPIVVRLVNQIDVKAKEFQEKPYEELAMSATKEAKPTVETTPEIQPPFEPFLPKTPTNQFMVEKISGFMVAADIVRIDGEIVEQWSNLYEGKQFSTVIIEALDGKKATCKFKAIKDAKNSRKGIIQIPEKILQTLQTEKGNLVMVKPVIE